MAFEVWSGRYVFVLIDSIVESSSAPVTTGASLADTLARTDIVCFPTVPLDVPSGGSSGSPMEVPLVFTYDYQTIETLRINHLMNKDTLIGTMNYRFWIAAFDATGHLVAVKLLSESGQSTTVPPIDYTQWEQMEYGID